MFRIRTVFQGIQGAPWLSTMYFGEGASNLAQDAVTAVGAFWGAVDAHISNLVNWSTESDVAVISDLGVLTGVDSTTPATGSGAAVADPLPMATQGLVRWRTGLIVLGRELRGRTFVPGLTESAAVDGGLAAAVQSDIQTAADALMADVNSALVVWSRTHSVSATAQAATVWSQFAVQRSRRD